MRSNGIADGVVEPSGSFSETVQWEYAEEIEEAPLLIYIAVVIGFVALALVVEPKLGPSKTSKNYALDNHVGDDVTATDEDAPAEDDEQSTTSVYDLQIED